MSPERGPIFYPAFRNYSVLPLFSHEFPLLAMPPFSQTVFRALLAKCVLTSMWHLPYEFVFGEVWYFLASDSALEEVADKIGLFFFLYSRK